MTSVVMVRMPKPRIPHSDALSTLALCERMVPGGHPVLLDIEPATGALVNECYENVGRTIATHGGTVQYGWQLWEPLPEVMIEAEFHAVWIDAHDVPHDVTPKSLDIWDRILFLPDPNRRYEGRQINNVRVALVGDPLVDQFIQGATRVFEELNRGELAMRHGAIGVTPAILSAITARDEALRHVVAKYFTQS